MYLNHFKLTEFPFGLTPHTDFFCQLNAHQEALNVLLFCLRSGEGFIKIIGEVGAGKTLLCRKLLESLDENFFTAYFPNPDLQPIELRKMLARELGISFQSDKNSHEIHGLINDRLLALHQSGKKVVLILDEGQALPDESLEALRLLTNLETEKSKLLQVVLFAQPELDQQLEQPKLRQLKQRITFSYYLPLLSREEIDTYLCHRLAVAGHTLGMLFNKKAKDLLYRGSQGVPRLINILCHKSLLLAYGRGDPIVTPSIMRAALRDSQIKLGWSTVQRALLALLSSLMICAITYYLF